MRSSKSSLNLYQIAFITGLVLAGQSFAQFHESVVYKFAGSPDGSRPAASLVADAAGNLYGATADGGIQFSCCGTIFELSPPATTGGTWSETVLYQFQGGSDGATPLGTLILDKLGNLYGTTGGSGDNAVGSTIFELSPPSTPGGAWKKTTLFTFSGSQYLVAGKLVMDAAGNLYGTTESGGTHNAGIAFELVAPKTAGAAWAERTLYDFHAFASDGFGPGADLLLRGGILYGTTQAGGTANQGTVFSLTPKPGLWTETILHTFTGSEGEGPRGGLIMDGAGNLFGTAQGTNSSLCNTPIDCGAIYELSPPAVAGDPWQETTLFRFSSLSTGADPYAALWRNKNGVLYGTTIYGGNGGNNGRNLGTVFKLVPPAIAGGDWTEVVLHYFRGTATGDGSRPTGALIWSNGAFYGTTEGGGDGNGTVFRLSFTP
jgi:uncharacterized repeat protein (TIGR03803 family)